MTRVAIITGASRGIGRATAIRLAQDFTAVAIVARTAGTLAETADAVRAIGAEPLALTHDLREPNASQAVVAATLGRFGRIEGLACIAGAVPQADLFALSDAQWDDGLSLKFHSARRLTIAAWKALKMSGGSVAITSGVSAYTPKASLAAVGTINGHSGARQGVRRSRHQGRRPDQHGAPRVGDDRSAAFNVAGICRHAQTRSRGGDRALRERDGHCSLEQPEDVATAIAFLFAPDSHWVTGTALRVDGGETKVL